MKLNVKAFSLACGIVWGLGLFLLTWWIIAFDGATGEPTIIGRLYRGFNISPAGSFIGFVWAFVDGLIGGGNSRLALQSNIYTLFEYRIINQLWLKNQWS